MFIFLSKHQFTATHTWTISNDFQYFYLDLPTGSNPFDSPQRLQPRQACRLNDHFLNITLVCCWIDTEIEKIFWVKFVLCHRSKITHLAAYYWVSDPDSNIYTLLSIFLHFSILRGRVQFSHFTNPTMYDINIPQCIFLSQKCAHISVTKVRVVGFVQQVYWNAALWKTQVGSRRIFNRMVAYDNVFTLPSNSSRTNHVNYHPDTKVHGANMKPIWGRQDPGGPHVGPMNFAVWATYYIFYCLRTCSRVLIKKIICIFDKCLKRYCLPQCVYDKMFPALNRSP